MATTTTATETNTGEDFAADIPNGMKIIPCTCRIDAPFNCPQHGSAPEWREAREQMKLRAKYIKERAIALRGKL